MIRKLTATAALAVAAVTLTSIAAGSPVAAKQRIAIQSKGANDRFVLTPLTPGAIKPDTGTATFCCWSSRHIMRDGQAIELNDPQMTLTGKQGTLVARNRIEWVDLPGGWVVMTGTWRVISGTGVYAGLAGGGRGAGVQFANNSNGMTRFRRLSQPEIARLREISGGTMRTTTCRSAGPALPFRAPAREEERPRRSSSLAVTRPG